MNTPVYKIGVFGSASKEQPEDRLKKARAVGEALARRGVILVTGACGGLPYAAAEAAARAGASVWGYAPTASWEEQRDVYPEQDSTIYAKLVYVPRDFSTRYNRALCYKYRNVFSTFECDAGIVIKGNWGTLHEFCSLHDYGKVIGVLTTTGGVADELTDLTKKIKKETGAKIFFNRAPEQLVETIMQELARRKSI